MHTQAHVHNAHVQKTTDAGLSTWDLRQSEMMALVQLSDLIAGTYFWEGNATQSSTLAWEIPWTEEPDRLQYTGSWRVKHNWVTSLLLFTLMHWRRQWQPTPVFLPGESQGREPGGLLSMG